MLTSLETPAYQAGVSSTALVELWVCLQQHATVHWGVGGAKELCLLVRPVSPDPPSLPLGHL